MVQPNAILTVVMLDSREATTRMGFDPSWVRRVISRTNGIAADIIQDSGKIVREFGAESSLTAIFPTASAALRFVCDMQRRLQDPDETGEVFGLRAAVFTGEVDDHLEMLEGWILNKCENLKEACHDGQTLVSRSTQAVAGPNVPPDIRLKDLGVKHLDDLSQAESTYQLCHDEIRQDFPTVTYFDAPNNNLPQKLTAFIGRQKEIEDIKHRFYMSRFTSLVGPPGVGKTRLSIQVARDILPDHTGGAHFVDLSPIRDPGFVMQAVAKSLKIGGNAQGQLDDAVIEALGDKDSLLVLDNCEHLLGEAAAVVEKLTGACRNLQVIATSRQPLGIRGETVVRIDPLTTPKRGLTAEELEAFDCVQLFLNRAYLVEIGFDPDPDEMAAIGQICSDLDGIPLAIELAAARVNDHKVKDLSRVLKKQLGSAKVSRARSHKDTLEATTQWSYDLLTEKEQRLFRRLAAFVGSFDRFSAESVCSSEDLSSEEVGETLDYLVHKSMVVRETAGNRFDRYRLLETMSEFGRGLLIRTGTMEYWKSRHCQHYMRMAEEAAANLHGENQKTWLEMLEADHDNYRAAIEWALGSTDDVETAFRLILSIHLFWFLRGYFTEAISAAERLLRLMKSNHPDRRVTMLNLAGSNYSAVGELEKAVSYHKKALGFAERSKNPNLKASTLLNLGIALRQCGEIRESKNVMMECIRFCEEKGLDNRLYWVGKLNCGGLAVDLGEEEEAEALLNSALEYFREIKEIGNQGYCFFNLGCLRKRQKRLDEAEGHIATAVANFLEVRDIRGLIMCVRESAHMATLRDLYHKSAILCGVDDMLRRKVSAGFFDYEPEQHEEVVAKTRRSLGPARFLHEWEKGNEMGFDDLGRFFQFGWN